MKPASAIGAVCVLASIACGSPAPTEPATPATLVPASAPGSHIIFRDITQHGAAVTSYNEAGYIVTATGGAWVGSMTYGSPAPFIQFSSTKGQTVQGLLEVAAGGATFVFTSVDVYASVIPIPYTITGTRNGAVVFTTSGTVPNTFGKFKTVASPDSSSPIDLLKIALTNAAPACCGNPMGVDNLIFGQ